MNVKRVITVVVMVAGGLISCAVKADDVSLASVPPVVVKTVPEAGADGVDPKLDEIKVTFSKDMQDGSWSWSTTPATRRSRKKGRRRGRCRRARTASKPPNSRDRKRAPGADAWSRARD